MNEKECLAETIDAASQRIDALLRECVQIIEHYQATRPEDQMYQKTMGDIKVRIGKVKFECNTLIAAIKK